MERKMERGGKRGKRGKKGKKREAFSALISAGSAGSVLLQPGVGPRAGGKKKRRKEKGGKKGENRGKKGRREEGKKGERRGERKGKTAIRKKLFLRGAAWGSEGSRRLWVRSSDGPTSPCSVGWSWGECLGLRGNLGGVCTDLRSPRALRSRYLWRRAAFICI